MPAQVDVCIIGGGPAGLAAALAARKLGFTVTVADSAVPPIDKPCGEGLMPDGIAALETLGVSIPPSEARPFRGIRFCSEDATVEAPFPRGMGLGIRRPSLHRIMADSAEAAGVRTLWHSVVTGMDRDGVRVGGELIRARWIIGADGGNSRVRRWAGLDAHIHHQTRYAFRRHFRVTPWTDFMELHWGPSCQLYVTPVGPEEVCVALISGNPKLRLQEALRYFPRMLRRLEGALHTSAEKGALTVTRKLRSVANDRVALVGDASGGVDAITGEGLCLAFKQTQLLARCLAAGDLKAYQSGHRSLARRPAMMSRLLLLLDGTSALRRRVLRALANHPQIFAGLLATHVGTTSPLDIASNTLALGWGLITA